MSSTVDQKTLPEDAKLAMLLLRKKVITDSQLKTALDYQRSLGGKVIDVLVKLDLVRPAQIEEVLNRGEAADEMVSPADADLDPAVVNVADLKVHRRLLDKLPKDLVSEYLIVLFFPLPRGDSRKIILGHARELSSDALRRIRGIVGVEMSALKLEEDVARDFLEGRSRPRARSEEDGAGPEVSKEVQVLVNLLIKKGFITQQDFEAELEGG